MKQYQWDRLFIDGAWRAPAASELATSINPATETVLGTVPQAVEADAVAAITAARIAFDEGPWPDLHPRERTRYMLRMAEIMRRRRDEICALDVAEVGHAQSSIAFTVDTPITRWVDLAERIVPAFAFEEPMNAIAAGPTLAQGMIQRQAFGVAALITPYNSPFYLALGKAGPALAAGCTIVLMPSPLTPLSTFLMAEIAEEAELPPGVFNVLSGSLDVGRVLTTHPGVDLVSFTGSDAVGSQIVSQSSGTLKKVVLELGGKSANIICDDVDLDTVVPSVVANFTRNSGQGCSMLTRTLVHASYYDDLIAAIAPELDKITIGDPADPDVDIGPLISADQRERVEALVSVGVEEGAEIAYGGGRPSHLSSGFFLEPTLLVNVENTMAVARQEFFGPVGVVIPFDTDEEAVALANDSEYGLNGGVWSKDPLRAYRIAQRLRTGNVSVNGGNGLATPYSPFGGYKRSGFGREQGSWGLSEFLQYKSIQWSVASL